MNTIVIKDFPYELYFKIAPILRRKNCQIFLVVQQAFIWWLPISYMTAKIANPGALGVVQIKNQQ